MEPKKNSTNVISGPIERLGDVDDMIYGDVDTTIVSER